MKLSIENIERVGESKPYLILLNKYLFNLNKVTTYQTHVKTNIYISIMFILHILILSVLKLNHTDLFLIKYPGSDEHAPRWGEKY